MLCAFPYACADVKPTGVLITIRTNQVFFVPATRLEADIQLVIRLPIGFSMDNGDALSMPVASSFDGVLRRVSVANGALTVARANGTMAEAQEMFITISNVAAPATVGGTDYMTLEARLATGELKNSANIPTKGSGPSVYNGRVLWSRITSSPFVLANSTISLEVQFATESPLNYNDVILLTLPKGLQVGPLSVATPVAGMDGELFAAPSGTGAMMVARGLGTLAPSGSFTISLSNVRVPLLSGPTSGLVIETRTSNDVFQDQPSPPGNGPTVYPAALGAKLSQVTATSVVAGGPTALSFSLDSISTALEPEDRVSVLFPPTTQFSGPPRVTLLVPTDTEVVVDRRYVQLEAGSATLAFLIPLAAVSKGQLGSSALLQFSVDNIINPFPLEEGMVVQVTTDGGSSGGLKDILVSVPYAALELGQVTGTSLLTTGVIKGSLNTLELEFVLPVFLFPGDKLELTLPLGFGAQQPSVAIRSGESEEWTGSTVTSDLNVVAASFAAGASNLPPGPTILKVTNIMAPLTSGTTNGLILLIQGSEGEVIVASFRSCFASCIRLHITRFTFASPTLS